MSDKNYYKKVEEVIADLRDNDGYREMLFEAIRKGKFDLFDIFSKEDILESIRHTDILYGEDVFYYFDDFDVRESLAERYDIAEIYSEEEVKRFVKDYIDTNL